MHGQVKDLSMAPERNSSGLALALGRLWRSTAATGAAATVAAKTADGDGGGYIVSRATKDSMSNTSAAPSWLVSARMMSQSG